MTNRWKENSDTDGKNRAKRPDPDAGKTGRKRNNGFRNAGLLLLCAGAVLLFAGTGPECGTADGKTGETSGIADGKAGESGGIAVEEAVRNSEPADREAEGSGDPAEREAGGSGGIADGRQIDFGALCAVNPDTVAWLSIPGTSIDGPVVQAADNGTYLNRDFEGRQSAAGTLFLDCDSDPDFMGRHSVIYGHHMKDGGMFAPLVKFREEEFFREHKEIDLYLPDRTLRLLPVAAVVCGSDGRRRKTRFGSREELAAYAEEMTAGCPFRRPLPETLNRLYSFVTCSYETEDARTVVYAVPAGETAG